MAIFYYISYSFNDWLISLIYSSQSCTHWHWYTKQLLILNQSIINPFIVITEAEKSQTNRFGEKCGSMITLIRIQIFFCRKYIFLWNAPQHSTLISIPRHNTKMLHLLRIIYSKISTFHSILFHYYSKDRIKRITLIHCFN